MKKLMTILALGIFTVSLGSANTTMVQNDEQICSAAAMAAGDAAEANGADSLQAYEIANDTCESCMN